MQPEAQKLQGGMPNARRKISLHAGFVTARWVKDGFLPVLTMPERTTEHIACRKSGIGCKCLGDIE
jgi:hypothetical protein